MIGERVVRVNAPALRLQDLAERHARFLWTQLSNAVCARPALKARAAATAVATAAAAAARRVGDLGARFDASHVVEFATQLPIGLGGSVGARSRRVFCFTRIQMLLRLLLFLLYLLIDDYGGGDDGVGAGACAVVAALCGHRRRWRDERVAIRG